MAAITICFDNGMMHEEHQPTFSVSGQIPTITKENIKKFLDKARKQINKWLLFGEAQMVVTDYDTGEVYAQGRYSYNAFSGHGEYHFQMEN